MNVSSGYGPSIDGLFFQSNLGVVTKMGIHLQSAPHHFLNCDVSVPDEEDLLLLTSTIARLERSGIIQNHASIGNSFRQAMMLGPPAWRSMAQYWGSHKAVPYSVLETLRDEFKLGFWKAEFALYGSKSMCDVAWKEVQEAFKNVPGVKFNIHVESSGDERKPLVPAELAPLAIPHSGFPVIDPIKTMDIRGQPGAHTCFAPLFPPNGKEFHQWYLRSKKLVEDADIDYFSDFHVYGRYIIAIIVLIYGPGEGPKVDRLYRDLMVDAAKNGVSEYRTHIDYMDEIAGHYSWNNGVQRRFLQKIKDVTDPRGILSQGKSGIWNAGHEKTTL